MRKTRKVVVFIVEGKNDEIALEGILSKMLDNIAVKFKVIQGDITSNINNNSENIKMKVNEKVIELLRQYKLNKKDILRLVHIIDTDGAFIHEDFIVEDFESYWEYKLNCILHNKRDEVIKRNERKRKNVCALHSIGEINSMCYSIYYFSRNFEHVAENRGDKPEKDEKEKISERFSKKYIDNIDEFTSFICSSDFSITEGYSESWEFIKKDTNSLKRYSNFGIFIKEVQDRNYNKT